MLAKNLRENFQPHQLLCRCFLATVKCRPYTRLFYQRTKLTTLAKARKQEVFPSPIYGIEYDWLETVLRRLLHHERQFELATGDTMEDLLDELEQVLRDLKSWNAQFYERIFPCGFLTFISRHGAGVYAARKIISCSGLVPSDKKFLTMLLEDVLSSGPQILSGPYATVQVVKELLRLGAAVNRAGSKPKPLEPTRNPGHDSYGDPIEVRRVPGVIRPWSTFLEHIYRRGAKASAIEKDLWFGLAVVLLSHGADPGEGYWDNEDDDNDGDSHY